MSNNNKFCKKWSLFLNIQQLSILLIFKCSETRFKNIILIGEKVLKYLKILFSHLRYFLKLNKSFDCICNNRFIGH